MQEENVMLVALISGNVIMGESTSDKGAIQMVNPVAFVKVADEVNNRTRDAMVPYAPLAEGGVVLIQPTAIEYVAAPKQVLLDQYRQLITGIVVPQKSIIAAA